MLFVSCLMGSYLIELLLIFSLIEPGGCNEGNVRLVNGTLTREGRLEVCVRGVWGRVCAYNFRKSAAYIACKLSGFHNVRGIYIYIYMLILQ